MGAVTATRQRAIGGQKVPQRLVVDLHHLHRQPGARYDGRDRWSKRAVGQPDAPRRSTRSVSTSEWDGVIGRRELLAKPREVDLDGKKSEPLLTGRSSRAC